MRASRIALCGIALVLALLLASSAAYASVPPYPTTPVIVRNVTFEPGSVDPVSGNVWAQPSFVPTPTAWWGPVAGQGVGATYGLWCAGTNGALPFFPVNTAGGAGWQLPDTGNFYQSSVSFDYKWPTPADFGDFAVRAFDPGVNAMTGSPSSVLLPNSSQSYTTKTFTRTASSPNLTEGTIGVTAGSLGFQFIDFEHSGQVPPNPPQGPTIDNLLVTGYRYGPVRSLEATRVSDTNVLITWNKPQISPTSSTDVTGSPTYRVWRHDINLGSWTELTSASSPVSDADRSITDMGASAVNDDLDYIVQAWGSGSEASYYGVALPSNAIGPPRTILRISGTSRYTTAIQTALSGYPGWAGVKHLVLASGDYNHQPDALTAAGLAGAYNAPLLLMPSNYLDPDVKAAIQAMPAGVQVHIVGGTPSISAAIATKVKALSKVKSVDRIFGADRYSTASAVATRMKSVLGGGFPKTALLTNGSSTSLLFDPLIASTASARQHFPVLLLKNTSVPSPTSTALKTLGLTTRYVIGGTGAVADSVLSNPSINVSSANRIFGDGVAGDAAAFADRAKQLGWLANTQIGFAAAVPDAATGGAYMGKLNGSLLLVSANSIPTVTSDYLTANASSILGGRVFGGPPSVSESVRTQLAGYLN
jgi:hypothetical protein